MTKEANAEKDAVVNPDKPIDSRGDTDRRVVVFASVLLLLLQAPVFLPVDGERSLWRITRHDDTGRAILAVTMGWPMLLGCLGLVHGLRRRFPTKTVLGLATALTIFQTLAGCALMVMLLVSGNGDNRSTFLALGALSPFVGFGLVVRSFFRTEWQRWQHLVAAIALLAVMIVLSLAGVERNFLERASQGGWGFIFATAALVPFIGTTVVSQKA